MDLAVKDIMTTRVIWVKKDASFQEMAAALRQHRVSAFPVLDEDGKVIGVVSEADMLNKEALGSEPEGMPGVITGILRRKEQEKARGITAGDLMTATPITVSPGDTVEHAARLMYTRRVKRLPVVDADRHLAGIISRADVLSVFDRSDADIREDIRTGVLRHEFFVNPDTFEVAVKAGVVTLAGKPRPARWAGRSCTRSGTSRAWSRCVTGSATRQLGGTSMSRPPSRPTDTGPARERDETMNALVKDIMTTPVVAVMRGATFKETRASRPCCWSTWSPTPGATRSPRSPGRR